MLNNARFYSSLGMNVIPCSFKFPKVLWLQYTRAPIPDAPSLFDWEVNAIAGISGVNDYTVLDFDKADLSFIDDVLSLLQLPPDYPWVVESGSGKGFHLWFRFMKTDSFINKFGDKSYMNFYPKNSAICHHAELRLRNCYTILPPSSHVSGLAYSYHFAEPDSQPLYISESVLEKYICDNFVFNPSLNLPSRRPSSDPIVLSDYETVKLSSAVQFLAGALGDGCYPTWNKLGLALCSLGKEGLPFFISLSNNPHYQDSQSVVENHFFRLLRSYNGSISLGSVFFIAQHYGWKPPFFPFWSLIRKKVVFDYGKYINFLSDNNFSKLLFNGDYFLCYTDGIFINIVNEIFFKDYVYLFIKNLPEFSGKNQKHATLILDSIIKSPFLFKRDTFEFLPTLDLNLQADTEKEGFFFFKNCYLKITPDNIEPLPYSSLETHVFSDRVIKKSFSHSSVTSDFETFCLNICNKDSERFNALRSSLGYLLHSFKNPVCAKAIVFIDENYSDGAAGRSGKSLLAKSLSYMRILIELDGKNFTFNDRFAFQRVSPACSIVLFNDVDKAFPIEKLYNVISDSFIVQRKNHAEIALSFQEAPKVIITLNNTIRNADPSAKARMFEVEFSSYYNIFRTPFTEFKKRFFDQWDESEWNSFYTFMAGCLQYYLKYGLHEYSFVNLHRKKIMDATSPEFFEYIEQNIVFNEYISKPKFFDDFRETEPTFTELKSQTFFKWVKYYASVYNYTYQEKRMGFPQVRHFCIIRPDTIL